MKKIISLLALTYFTLFLNGCAVYKPEVQQGNALNKEDVAQLSRGMSREEVISILGNPLLQDNFRADRWDYVYYDGKGKSQRNKQNLTLFFKNDQLVQVKK